MSFREKHLWISIVATVGVWGFYGWRLMQAIAGGGLIDPGFAFATGGLFIGCLVVVVLLEVGLTFLATATTRRAEREARDERELVASLKASHVSLMALIAIVFSLAIAAYLLGFANAASSGAAALPMTPTNALIFAANILMGAVIVSELIRYVFNIALLRGMR
ncbi:hypothetical protein [Brevundimonas sp. TWP2-3-4b1]|uniref:hypothetical protein n=1 Tax=Brevundimonas sp. TWP2-3-4b1 TaxID=2804580 RepID=UPI003CF8B4C8